MQEQSQSKSSLRSRLRGIHFAAPMVMALVVTLGMIWQVHRLDMKALRQAETEVQEQQLTNVRNCQRSMVSLLGDCLARLGQLSNHELARQWAQWLVEGNDQSFTTVGAWDASGELLWSTGTDLAKPVDDWAQVSTLSQRDSFYSCQASPPSASQPCRQPELVLLVVPSHDAQGQLSGYVGGIIDMQRVLARTIHPIPSDSKLLMRYWVLDQANNVLLHLAPPPKTPAQAVFTPIRNLSDHDRSHASQIGLVGWSSDVYPRVALVKDPEGDELVAFQAIQMGHNRYLLAVTAPANAVTRTILWHRLTSLSLMLGLVVLLGLAWWISRGLEATQVRLRAEQRFASQVQQAQEALLASERRYRDWIHNLPIGICRLAVEPFGLILRANPSFSRMLTNNPNAGLEGTHLLDYMFNPVGIERLSNVLAESGGATAFETSFNTPSGRTFATLTATPVRGEHGQIEYFETLVQDVTQAKLARRALKDSQQHLEAVVHSAPLVLWTTDSKGVFDFIEGAALPPPGPRIPRLGGRLHDVVGSPANADQALERCMGGEVVSVTSQHAGRWFETNIASIERQNEPQGLIGVSIDISQRYKAEQDLRTQREQMELIFRHSSDGICIRTMDTTTFQRRLVVCNDRFAEMSGYSRQELMARYGSDKLLMHHSSELERRRQKDLLLRHQPISGVDSWIRPDGAENFHEYTSVPIPASSNRMLIVDIHRDITHRLKTEEALRQAHRQLVNAREQERRRLARELHDSIGQGLVALQLAMRSALTVARTAMDDATQQRLNESMRQCSRLVGEIRQLCHGLYPPTLESLGLVAALQQLVRSCSTDTCLVELRCVEDLYGKRFTPDVEITMFRIAQEAVSNALRHSSANRIEVGLSLGPDVTLYLRVFDDGKGFDIAACSSGLGMVSMRERAQSVGGVLILCSEAGATAIKAAVPVAPAVQQT